jgi:hypothetical protein
MKTSLRATLAATALAVASIANLASLPSAALTVATGLVVSGQALANSSLNVTVGKLTNGKITSTVSVKTAVDGSFQLTGLAPGDYQVTPDGGKPAIFKVGADGKFSGVVRTGGVVQTSAGAQPVNAVDKKIASPELCQTCPRDPPIPRPAI